MSEDEGSDAASPSAALDALDYYTLLGVAEDATRADIRAAFRRFALRYHPDRFAGEAPALAQRALAIYRRGTEAVDVLCDVDQRRAYDAVLARGEKRLTEDAALTLRRASPPVTTGQRPTPAAPAPKASPPPSPPMTPRPPLAAPQAPSAQHTPPQAPTEAKAMPTFGKPGAGVKATRPRPARPTKTSRRAMPAVRDAAPPKPAPAPLRIQSPQAKAFFERATKAKAEGDLRSAWRMLKAAVEAEPDNAALESELYAVERNFRP